MQFLFGRIVHTVESDHLAVDFDWPCHKGIDTLRFQQFIDGFACFLYSSMSWMMTLLDS